MHNLIDRRQFIGTVATGGVVVALTSTGCSPSDSGNGGTSSSSDGKGAEEISLVFRESKEFYEDLDDALAKSDKVVVAFDGTDRIGRDSPMLKEYLASSSNAQEIYDIVTRKDTEVGRDELKMAFQEELLEHQEARTGLKTPNGEVIEPGTVLLILGIILIAATASVAHAESARGRTYRVEVIVSPNSFSLIFGGQQA